MDLYDRTCYQAALRRTGNSVREKERPPLRNLSQFRCFSRELCESSGNSKICRSLFLALCDSKINSCHDCIILKVSSVRYNLWALVHFTLIYLASTVSYLLTWFRPRLFRSRPCPMRAGGSKRSHSAIQGVRNPRGRNWPSSSRKRDTLWSRRVPRAEDSADRRFLKEHWISLGTVSAILTRSRQQTC